MKKNENFDFYEFILKCLNVLSKSYRISNGAQNKINELDNLAATKLIVTRVWFWPMHVVQCRISSITASKKARSQNVAIKIFDNPT